MLDNIATNSNTTKRHRQAKLNYDQAMDVLKRIENGEKQKDIAAHYGVSDATISLIKYQRTYQHLNRAKATKITRIRLDEPTKHAIKIKLNCGHTVGDIAKQYGVSHSMISMIKNNY